MRGRNLWLAGMMGLIVGDALGDPVQFMSREEVRCRKQGPVTGMEPAEQFGMPEGAWTDDSSLALATADSILTLGRVDPEDIMERFVSWLEDGAYTPLGVAFDIGNTCMTSIKAYEVSRDVRTCGGTSVWANGNGSLMRILPVCLYAAECDLAVEEAVALVESVGGLTHAHLRAGIACGLYYFCVRAVLQGRSSLKSALKVGLEEGFRFYERDILNRAELAHYGRLRDLETFGKTPESDIRSSGYVVDSLEAAVWSLVRSDSYKECLLTAVNLGDDADSVGAIAGGLAGLFYGYDAIPEEWRSAIIRREWIEELLQKE